MKTKLTAEEMEAMRQRVKSLSAISPFLKELKSLLFHIEALEEDKTEARLILSAVLGWYGETMPLNLLCKIQEWISESQQP